MLIVGTLDWPKTVETGEFYCPVCNDPKKFRRRVFRPFLTVYFVPLIPIGGKQEYVECMKCNKRFPSSVLDDKSTQRRAFHDDLLTILALTILEDGHVSEAEITRSLDVQRTIGQNQISREELAMACATARAKQQTLAAYLWNGKTRWARSELQCIVQAIFVVAGADGQISPSRMKALRKTQQILGLTTEEFQNCIVEAEQLTL